jgi:transcriptional regulator of acetoin/glycerol metabolism
MRQFPAAFSRTLRNMPAMSLGALRRDASERGDGSLTNSDAPRPAEANDALAQARVRFLTSGSSESAGPAGSPQGAGVRQSIVASWWRSRTWKVAADHIELSYVKDPNLETALAHSAAPVLTRLAEQLSGTAVSIILTDADGVVLDRRTGDGQLEQRLDWVNLAPGFSYAESSVGTNGIGTALEGGQAADVFGHEHYAEGLDEFGCAGVPVRHPITGQLLGVLDLTCWSKDASPLLMALARTTAGHIERELTATSGRRELALFQEYLRACRHSNGIVFALNNDVVMMNDYARQVLSPQDQAMLLATAADAMHGSKRAILDVDLPTGARARLYCSPVLNESGPSGGVVRVRLAEPADPTAPGRTFTHPLLPGIVGSGALWQRACDEVCAHQRDGEWVTVHGEPGAGKLALLRAVHRRYDPAGRILVLDAAAENFLPSVARELASGESTPEVGAGEGTLVLRHIDVLAPAARRELGTLLARHRDTRWWVAATHDTLAAHHDLDGVLAGFPSSVEVPPLRHHIEDIRELVPFLLVTLASGATLRCSTAAMRLLMRAKWPGNVAQLREVLHRVTLHRRVGVIEPGDLPPELQTVTGRVLNPLESIERDAIVRGLLDADGNKKEAARALGMSRATIYRKIREYGIDMPQ